MAQYKVRLFSPDGALVAIFDDWRSLQFQNKVSDVGFFVFTIDGNDDRVALFEKDGQIEVWRWISCVLDPYIEFEGHLENFETTLFENGNLQFTSVGSHYNGLLKRRVIAYTEDTVFSKKSDPAETAMKEYVSENCTSGADASREEGTQADAEIPGLTIEVDAGRGPTWNGERSGKPVLDTLRDIVVFAEEQADPVDFAVVGTRAANTGPDSYEFRFYTPQLGADRRAVGIDPATGRNVAGNAPHIFSPARENVETMRYAIKHRSSSSALYVWGAGRGANRAFGYAEDVTQVGVSRREVVRGGSSQTTDDERDDLAQEWLQNMTAAETFVFEPQDTSASMYGVHYHYGDRVTARLGDIERHKKITAVTVTVSSGSDGETKRVEFADIPR
jgi:hypothetical protein